MSRLILVLKSAGLLLLGSGITCAAFLGKAGVLSLPALGISLVIPGLATLLYLCVALAIPELFAGDKLQFPLNFTLPAVYTGLVLLTVTLISRIGPTITRAPEALNVMGIWASWPLLFASFLAGALALTIFGAKRRDQPNGDPS